MAKYLSVCSGIEAASVAWHPLGWQPLAFSEIEPFPRAVLAHHYPNVPCHGDFTKLRDMPFIVDADVLVGGTPCQAFSVAGLRNSLADERGNLSLEFVRLADAIDSFRRLANKDSAIIIWENVPGVLSVKDNAFGCFLAALVGEDAPLVPAGGRWTDAGVVIGPQRTVAWRILDAQYFGLAQRRRRVFVVASARERFDPAAVLLEFEGLRRDSPPRRETRQDAAAHAASGTGNRRSHWDGVEHPHALRGEGFDGSEDGTGRGTPLVPVQAFYSTESRCDNFPPPDVSPPLKVGSNGGGQPPAIAFSAKDHGGDATEELSPTLRAMPHDASHANGGGQMAVAFAHNIRATDERHGVAYPLDLRNAGRDPDKWDSTNRQGLGLGEDGEPSHTISTAFVPGVAYGFQPRIARNGRGDMGDVVSALNAQSGETGKGDAAPCVAFSMNLMSPGRQVREDDGVGALTADCHRPTQGNEAIVIQQHMAVRRLTPVECERLQGFPDNYTLISWRNKPAADCPDGPRYKALGNSMAVPCMRWIGARIVNAIA